ncbi:MAG: hypothetical protein AAF664_09240, partial [Planctomycetota bacterium]
MNITLRAIALSLFASTVGNVSYGCCLTDWLYGRTATPYAVGYAPAPITTPVIQGQAVPAMPVNQVISARPVLYNSRALAT